MNNTGSLVTLSDASNAQRPAKAKGSAAEEPRLGRKVVPSLPGLGLAGDQEDHLEGHFEGQNGADEGLPWLVAADLS
jgi:hypothetical protein